MIVYIVESDHGYDGSVVMGVFSTLELAKECCLTDEVLRYSERGVVKSWELDARGYNEKEEFEARGKSLGGAPFDR